MTHINETKLTLNGIQRRLFILHVEILHALAQDQSELNLIVQADTPWPDHWTLAGKQDRRRRLLEKEGLLRPGAVELRDVVPGCESATGAPQDTLGE